MTVRGLPGGAPRRALAAFALALLALGPASAPLRAQTPSQTDRLRQQRAELDRIRRELHCSSGVTNTDGSALTATPVSAIRVALPSHCPTAVGGTTTVDYQAVANGSGGWELLRVQGGSSIPIADYLIEDEVFTYTAASSDTRALLHVDFPVNVNPNEGWKTWRLVDDIVLRNTLRQDP